MFKKFKRWFQQKASPTQAILVGAGAGSIAWSSPDYKKMSEEGYSNCVIAFKCINKNAQAVASVPWVLKERMADGTEQPIYQHDNMTLLRHPNRWTAGNVLFYKFMCHLQIAGNAYLEGVGPTSGANAGMFRELHVKRPDRMQVIKGKNGPDGYKYTVEGRDFPFMVDPRTGNCNIHHWPLFAPLDDWYGMSPIEAASRDIDIHNAYGAWNYKMLTNDARPSGVATQDFESDPKAEEKLKKDLNKEYGGLDNVGKILVLPFGLKWTQLGLSPKDMEWLEGRNVTARDICNALGVPAMMINVPGDNKYANMVEAKLDHWESTITFYLGLLATELNHWLVRRWVEREGRDLFLEPDLSNTPIAQAQKDLKWKRAYEGGDFMTLNERRELVGLEKIDEGDVILVPMSMIPLDLALEGGDTMGVGEESVSKAAIIARLRREGFSNGNIKSLTQGWPLPGRNGKQEVKR